MNLVVSPAPHLHASSTTRSTMLDVIIALLPTAAAGVYFFGYRAAVLIIVSIISAVLSEYIWQKLAKKTVRIHDLSAAVTGLILALNLPANAPWWVAVIGAVFAVILVKQLFGGIGGNFLNPAMAARAALLASFPAIMTTYMAPGSSFMADAVTSATPLSGEYTCTLRDLFIGNVPGTIGEVCKIAILIGMVYLCVRRVSFPHIPIIMVGSAALCLFLFSGCTMTGEEVLRSILSGGLLFGAVFMATDYVTNPMTICGECIFAAGCGIIVAVIRTFGSYAEGVTYAILLMNIATPLIDKYIQPKAYGEVKTNA